MRLTKGARLLQRPGIMEQRRMAGQLDGVCVDKGNKGASELMLTDRTETKDALSAATRTSLNENYSRQFFLLYMRKRERLPPFNSVNVLSSPNLLQMLVKAIPRRGQPFDDTHVQYRL